MSWASIKGFVRDWMLPIGMTTGVALYLVYMAVPFLHPAGPALLSFVKFIQPVLLFSMLFLTFCRIRPRDLRPHRWQWMLLAVQGGLFVLLAALLLAVKDDFWAVVIESAMLCLICPTATAAAVVTGKLDGDIAGIITYTILINLVVAVLVPLVVPVIHPAEGVSFVTSFGLIIAKVFPLLICPCLLAWLVRYCFPRLHRFLISTPDLPFYIWAVSLTLALMMTARAMVHSGTGLFSLFAIGVASLLSCVFQFWAGRRIGDWYDRRKGGASHVERITAGQAMGQKNTVFAIWMGYTFMSPVVSVAGGFYSIWHNVFNSWQLYRHDHRR